MINISYEFRSRNSINKRIKLLDLADFEKATKIKYITNSHHAVVMQVDMFSKSLIDTFCTENAEKST